MRLTPATTRDSTTDTRSIHEKKPQTNLDRESFHSLLLEGVITAVHLVWKVRAFTALTRRQMRLAAKERSLCRLGNQAAVKMAMLLQQ